MQYSSPKDFLKALKIQRNYVNKFRVNYANHNDLTIICCKYIECLDNKINELENFISLYKLKQSKIQINIYDFIEVEK